MSPSVLTPAPERRTQAQRRADTRRALLDATAASLVEHGYAGTSTTVICQRAGVSQGALFKHFATKGALLGAAAAHLYDQLTERFLLRFEAIDPVDRDPAARVEQAIALLWDLFQSPEYTASLDLELAARTDAALRAELGSVLTRHAVRVRELSAQLFPGRTGDPAYDRTIDLVLEVMVGMAVSRIADPDPVHYRLLLAHVTTLAQQAVLPSPSPRPA